jgi:hypothetical protein
MAEWRSEANVHVTGRLVCLGMARIDNNPTPSYVSVDISFSLVVGAYRVEFARKVPHSGAPEANPAVAA